MEAGTVVDVIGVVDTVENWAVITRKDGKDTQKRSLTIRDDSGRSVEVGCCGGGGWGWGCKVVVGFRVQGARWGWCWWV